MPAKVFDEMPHRRNRIVATLVYAFLEWILILLLFLNSFLSFLVAKFVDRFSLKPLCSLCSRLDHLWGSKGPINFHFGRLCEAHGAQISRLGYCFRHRQLAEAKSLCSDCLFSDGMIGEIPSKDAFLTWLSEDNAEYGEANRCSCCDEVILMSRKAYAPSMVLKPAWDVIENEASIAEVIDADLDGEETSATVTDQSNSLSQTDQMKHDPFWTGEWNEEDESVYITDILLQNADYVDSDRFICIELIDTDTKPTTCRSGDSEEEHGDKPMASLAEDRLVEADLVSTNDVEIKGLDTVSMDVASPSPVAKGKYIANGIEDPGDFPEYEQEVELDGHTRAVGTKLCQHYFEENESDSLLEEGRCSPKAAMDESLQKSLNKPITNEKQSRMEDLLEESVANEMEVEHESFTMDHLKFKVKAQEKALNALYAELDEERKAAAVAANVTMAMITKLQEEKAAMQMEAHQYQRIMEEQAEYDQEALQLLNELMMKREKEKQELESELEIYRTKVLVYEAREKISMIRSQKGSCSSGQGENNCRHSVGLDLGGKEDDFGFDICRKLDLDDVSEEERDECITGSTLPDISLAEFDEERLLLLDDLKALEAKLYALYDNETQLCGGIKSPSEQLSAGPGDDLVTKKLLPLSDTEISGEMSKVIIQEELSHVYERLQVLEADKEFLEHCINSMSKGDKGLALLQEILQHLRGLRSVEFPSRNPDEILSTALKEDQ